MTLQVIDNQYVRLF